MDKLLFWVFAIIRTRNLGATLNKYSCVTRRQQRDRISILTFHSVTACLDIYVYMFRGTLFGQDHTQHCRFVLLS
jgi:hypothetical protein